MEKFENKEKAREVISAENAFKQIDRALSVYEMDSDAFLADKAYSDMRDTFKEKAIEYGRALFDGARSASGKKRIDYAETLIRFEQMIGEQRIQEVFDALLTNRTSINELIRTGEEELKK